MDRRKFLKDAGKLLALASTSFFLQGCEQKTSERDNKIRELQEGSFGVVDYISGKGYEYKLDLGNGETAVVNVSKNYFYTHGNSLAWTLYKNGSEECFVRVFHRGKIHAYSSDLSRQILLENVQIKTDQIIKSTLRKNQELFNTYNEEISERLKNHPKTLP